MKRIASKSEELRPELLAAYVDGELDEATAARVERWLETDPRAQAALEAQERFAPGHQALWKNVKPECPTAAAWNRVRNAVKAGICQENAARKGSHSACLWRKVAAGGVGCLAAAVVLILAYGGQEGPGDFPAPGFHLNASENANPLDSLAVLPIAAAVDVDIESLHGGDWRAFPVGDPHMPGSMTLATIEDLRIEEVAPDPAWPSGRPRTTLGPGDAPIMYAASLKEP